MNCGRVYIWLPDSSNPLGGRVTQEVVPLKGLDTNGHGEGRLRGRYVHVRNAGMINETDQATGLVRPVPIGDAQPNNEGDFVFEPGRGGGRVDKVISPEPDFQWRYIQASHFGEVNSYYHLNRIAEYIDELLHRLGAASLPPITALVNAHHAATEEQGIRDGVRRGERWLPFQGGHYRLPGRSVSLTEREPISPNGEIHLGPGRGLLHYGALVEAAGGRYRANASHNAGILCHEYGHHITRHTADFRANALRRPDQQDNRKAAIDEGTCDYWAATMLETPHIWAWHNRHDDDFVHPRSLISSKTLADLDRDPKADPHLNGTIWGSTLWDFRAQFAMSETDGARQADLLLLQALLLIRQLPEGGHALEAKNVRRARADFDVGLSALLEADDLLFSGRHHEVILATFAKRGIRSKPIASVPKPSFSDSFLSPVTKSSPQMQRLLKHVTREEIPQTDELFSADALETHVHALGEAPLSLIAVGDIMLGGRARKVIAKHGPDYPFKAILPLLQRSPIVLGNLEGPLAREAEKQDRNYSYRVNPKAATSLSRAGINVVTLANNHLLDCGRAGVLETLEALAATGVASLGAGVNKDAAHAPVILKAGARRVGLLGYYWNRRTAAIGKTPGSAMDSFDELESDIGALRKQVDRIVVTFHWGVPYVREPSAHDRAKARYAVDCGADAVIGHHAHIVQPFEVYRGCPIFFGIGNFAFGSGNSRGEGLLIGLRFEDDNTQAELYPLYVKNRDPRVNYQPKLLRGKAATNALSHLAEISGADGHRLKIEEFRGRFDLQHRPVRCERTHANVNRPN